MSPKVSTYLSDEEGNDGNFMLRCSERSKLRRKTSRCISGIEDAPSHKDESANKKVLTVETTKDGQKCLPNDSMAPAADASSGKEATRVEPGEIDSEWPVEASSSRKKRVTICDTLPSVQGEFCAKGSSNVSGPATSLRKHAPPPLACKSTMVQGCNGNSAANIHVACRFRPLISREVTAGDSEYAVNFSFDSKDHAENGASVELSGRSFALDRVFAPSALQAEVYSVVARPIVQDVLEGYNGTVMAYGSTGSGKTYTMEGRVGDPELLGIIPRMVSTLLDGIDQAADTMEFTLKLSAVEIYMERIIDLLRHQGPDAGEAASTNVKVREDPIRGVWVDAVERHATNEADVFAVAHAAQASRRVAATHMNVRSSRSHYILMLRLTALDKQTLCERQGVLYLVDLAGSEKVSQTGAAGQTLEEAKKINRSLSCLGNVIVALTEERERQHVPYRDSKLTRVLQQSLGGNAKTALIATCSLATSCLGETLTTLRFAERVKTVRNTPKVNEQRSMEQLMRELNDSTRTIAALKRDLASLQNNTAPASPTRSIGTSTWDCATSAGGHTDTCTGSTVDEVSKDPECCSPLRDVLSDLLAPGARKALLQFKHELNVTKRERDAAYEQLSQMRNKGVQAKRPSPGEEADGLSDVIGKDVKVKVKEADGSSSTLSVPYQCESGKAMRMLEAECAALRFQVTSLAEARVARDEDEKKLKEEVLLLRDSAARSSQENDFLKRERDELRQLLQTCCSGDLEEERKHWDEILGNEVARREATCEQWRAYLSNRVHKVVQLEIEVDYLRDALASLQLSPHQLGVDITALPGSQRPAEVTGSDGDEGEPQDSWLQRLQEDTSLEDSIKQMTLCLESPGRHANVAQPVIRRRRQRSCERHLPSPAPSPASMQFSAASPDTELDEKQLLKDANVCVNL